MIRINKIFQLKGLNTFIALLILVMQLIPNIQNESFANQKLPELSYGNSVFIINVIINPFQQQLVRQNPEINFSPSNSSYDKYDITAIPDLTNSKKIYGGGFSHLHRYSTFLTVFFSTST